MVCGDITISGWMDVEGVGDVTRWWYNVGWSIKESPAPGWRHSLSTFGVRVMACDVT